MGMNSQPAPWAERPSVLEDGRPGRCGAVYRSRRGDPAPPSTFTIRRAIPLPRNRWWMSWEIWRSQKTAP